LVLQLQISSFLGSRYPVAYSPGCFLFAGICALYGQACNAATPCCNNVQCTYSPKNAPCGPTDTGCTCYNPITIGFQGGTP